MADQSVPPSTIIRMQIPDFFALDSTQRATAQRSQNRVNCPTFLLHKIIFSNAKRYANILLFDSNNFYIKKTIHVLWCTTNQQADRWTPNNNNRENFQPNEPAERTRQVRERRRGRVLFQSDSFNNHLTDNRVEVAVASRVINITAVGWRAPFPVSSWTRIYTQA